MHNLPQSGILNDGNRLHLNHGPIDLIIEAFGDHENTLRRARDLEHVVEHVVLTVGNRPCVHFLNAQRREAQHFLMKAGN